MHVGQDDMAVEDARRLLGREAIIGISIKTFSHAANAPVGILDYAGIGGVYATSSKDNPEPPIGPSGLRMLASGDPRRQAGFSGLRHRRHRCRQCGETIVAGADGVAVISALSLAPDPAAAARELRGIVDAALAKRGPQ